MSAERTLDLHQSEAQRVEFYIEQVKADVPPPPIHSEIVLFQAEHRPQAPSIQENLAIPVERKSKMIPALVASSATVMACNLTLPGLGLALGAGVSSAIFTGAILSPFIFEGIKDKAQKQNLSLLMGAVGVIGGLVGSFYISPGAIIGGEIFISLLFGVQSLALRLSDFLNSLEKKDEK